MQVHCSYLKKSKAKLGWLFPVTQYGVHCRGMACMGAVHERSLKAQKSPPRFRQGPCWQRWRLLGLYTLEWWDQDKCFWNTWLQNCMVSQRWGIQRKMHSAYSETWWWQCPYVGLHECCWCRGAAFHWWHHEFTNVLLYTEREDATITPCAWSSCTFPTLQWS